MPHSQRRFWNGDPERLPDGFTVTKAKTDHTLKAVYEVWTHQFGTELRLQIDGHGLLMSSVAKSGGEMIERVEEWHRAMREKGWRRVWRLSYLLDPDAIPFDRPPHFALRSREEAA